MIIAGLALIGGGAAAGGAAGAGSIAYKGYRDSKREKREDLRLRADLHSKGLCPECGAKVNSKDNFCKYCGNAFSNYNEESDWECGHCGKDFVLGKIEQIKLNKHGKIKVKCPHCNNKTLCEE